MGGGGGKYFTNPWYIDVLRGTKQYGGYCPK